MPQPARREPPGQRRTPVWIVAGLVLGSAGALAIGIHFGLELLTRQRAADASAPTQAPVSHGQVAPTAQVPVPAAAPPQTPRATRAPPAEGDLQDAIDYLRMRASTESDIAAAHEAAQYFGNWTREGRDDATLAALCARTQHAALELARRRTESVRIRLGNPLLAQHLPGAADQAAERIREARDAESTGDLATALRLYESVEDLALEGWMRHARVLAAEFEEARVRQDRTAGLRIQQDALQWRNLFPVQAVPAIAAPTTTPANNTPPAGPTRYVVSRDPVPAGVLVWEAERIASTPSGVRTDDGASGGRYVTQSSPGRPLVEFGFPPALQTMTLWVRARGAVVVFESAEPGRRRSEHARTDGSTGSWEWKRVGTFRKDAVASTLSLANYDANTWSGIDAVLLSPDPSIIPE